MQAEVCEVRVRRLVVERLAQQLDVSARRPVDRAEDVEETRLTTTRRAAQHDKLAAANGIKLTLRGEIDVGQRAHCVIAAGKTVG